VGIEARVLYREDGVAQGLGDLGERDEDPALDVEFREELVVVVVNLGAEQRLEGFQRRHRRQRAGKNRERPEGGHGDGERPQEEDDAADRHESPEPSPPPRLAEGFF